jgi:uncharacterized protein YihD (DUF1040 family)
MNNLDRADIREEILYFLEKAWVKNPHLRIMQLLGNGFTEGDNYYVDDQAVLDYLVKVANEVED